MGRDPALGADGGSEGDMSEDRRNFDASVKFLIRRAQELAARAHDMHTGDYCVPYITVVNLRAALAWVHEVGVEAALREWAGEKIGA